MTYIFNLIPFVLFGILFGMERELPVPTTKQALIIKAVCNGYIEKPFEKPVMSECSQHQYIFACLKCDKVAKAEKERFFTFCIQDIMRDDADAYCNMGYFNQYLTQPANPEEAKKYYAIAASKGVARAYYYLGECHESLNEKVLAFEAYKKAAALAYEPALIRLAQLILDSNQLQACELYRKADGLRRGFFKTYPELLEKNDSEDALIDAVKRGAPVLKGKVESIPYLYEKALLYPAYGTLFIKYCNVAQTKTDLAQRVNLGANATNDSNHWLNAGLLFYEAWNITKGFAHYRAAFECYKLADNNGLAEYELAMLYLNHEQETHNVKDICNWLWSEAIGKRIPLNKSDEMGTFKKVGNDYLEKAAIRGHEAAQKMISVSSLKISSIMSLEQMLELKTGNYKITIDDLPLINDCMKRFIKEHACLQKEELIGICTWFEFSCRNISLNEGKKDKAAKKLKKTNDQKISDFKKQCSQWVKDINDSYQKYEKQKKQEEKRKVNLEKEQHKKLLKADVPKLEAVSQAPSIKSVEYKEETEILNPLSSQKADIEKPVSQQKESDMRTEKKPKVKTRPVVSEQPQSEETSQDRPTSSAKPPLIRSMSAVALVKKNSKTDLNDPKYKRLVKRLSCSDLIGKLKLDETDIRRTLEELARRNLIDYRDEKTTITATKKNDHTVPLVIHAHGDWAANRDIVKQFLAFVYEVDSEYWQ